MHDALANTTSSSGNSHEEYSSLAHAIVARGPTEMIELFIENKRVHVADIMKAYENCESTTTDSDQNDNNIIYNSLNKALNAHIDYLGPYIHTWSSALALMADPRQVPNSISIMDSVLVDLISYTNIKTKRMDWYSERALLLLVYSSIELHMLSDSSDNFIDTRSFVERLLTTYVDIRKSPSMLTMLTYASKMVFK
jgi:ubiquinone biosynthesis protein COQ9